MVEVPKDDPHADIDGRAIAAKISMALGGADCVRRGMAVNRKPIANAIKKVWTWRRPCIRQE